MTAACGQVAKNEAFPHNGNSHNEGIKNMKLEDLTGKRFGRLVVLARDGVRGKKATWKCQCDCGNTHVVMVTGLKNGHTKSCGCLKIESDAIGSRYRHGQSNSPEYKVWAGMKDRCLNQNATFFSFYGGRGIKVCERWMTFENFRADMGPRPSLQHSIERKDNDGNYEPDNCKWATPLEQSNNTSRNVFITIGETTLTLSQWCRETGVDPDLASQRIIRDRWAPEDAVTTPSRG